MSTSSMHVAKTGLNAQQTRMQIIANNLANVNTTGFKRDRANFETLLYQVRRTAGDQVTAEANLTSSFSVGTGARIVNTQKAHTQGSLITTDNSLDLALEGGGFFQVLLPDGRVGYTRNGAFSTNSEGVLTTSSGYVLQPKSRCLTVSRRSTSRAMASFLSLSPEVSAPRRSASCRLQTSPTAAVCSRSARASMSRQTPAVRQLLATLRMPDLVVSSRALLSLPTSMWSQSLFR